MRPIHEAVPNTVVQAGFSRKKRAPIAEDGILMPFQLYHLMCLQKATCKGYSNYSSDFSALGR